MSDRQEQQISDIHREVKDIKRILQLLTVAMYGAPLKLVAPSALDEIEQLELTRLINRT